MTLGLVLTPYGYVPDAYPFEINKSGPSNGSMLCPPDPYYLQRGEYGFFHDTPFGGPRITALGAIPTDEEIGKHYYSWYTPVQSGWVYAKEPKRYIPGPWVPPHNESPIGPFGPRTSLRGLAESIIDSAVTKTEDSADKLIRVIEEHQRKQFTLSALGTAAAVLASSFTIYRTIQGILEDERRRKKETA